MRERTVAVISAGLRQPSSTRLLADRLAAATSSALQERGMKPSLDVIELRDHARRLTDYLLTGYASQDLREILGRVSAADGLIAVSPIFSASYNGLFKDFFDSLDPDALTGKPVLIGATAGTARHSLALEHALRPLFSYLRAVVVPTAVFAASEDWGDGGGESRTLAERVERAAGEFADLVVARDPKGITDPYTEMVPFEQMLNVATD